MDRESLLPRLGSLEKATGEEWRGPGKSCPSYGGFQAMGIFHMISVGKRWKTGTQFGGNSMIILCLIRIVLWNTRAYRDFTGKLWNWDKQLHVLVALKIGDAPSKWSFNKGKWWFLHIFTIDFGGTLFSTAVSSSQVLPSVLPPLFQQFGKTSLSGTNWRMKVPSGKHTKSYWKWSFIVRFPIKNCDFP